MKEKRFLQEQLDLIKTKQTDDSLTWQDITDFRYENTGIAENVCTTRKGAKLLLEYLNNGWDIVPHSQSNVSTELIALKQERYKIQTEKLELNKWLRESARDEMIAEEIARVVKELPSFNPPAYLPPDDSSENTYLFCFGDAHYGIEFEVKDLNGNILNAYSPQIFEERMW